MMIRAMVCTGVVFSLLFWALLEKSQHAEATAMLERERAAWERARIEAHRKAVAALEQMQVNYERRLRQQARARAAIEQERARVIMQIEEGKDNGPEDYRRWARQPLPAVVIDRLRQLPEERAAAGHHRLPDTTH
ncbi:hypothetical protein [Sulfurivirga sp.]|uniref:hypothetical protein n=1 Tax=Sulfurivirga sp. TaxID=2614236 RepID=UPI0025FA61DF|nr:hypothetical protein [Sulfurivirga sp.]